jgi:beta-galactosidase
VAWINGRNLGRYWNIGPQQTLYIPAEWLKNGTNELVIFELLESESTVSTIDKPVLDQLMKTNP